MIELFRAGPQARKVRFVMVLSWPCALGACWAGVHLARFYGLGPADGGVLAPVAARLALGFAVAASGVGFAAAMVLFGRLYVQALRFDRVGRMIHLQTIGLFSDPSTAFPVADVQRSTFISGRLDNPDGVSVNAPWYHLWVSGRRLPFILDAQGLSDEPLLLGQLLESKTDSARER